MLQCKKIFTLEIIAYLLKKTTNYGIIIIGFRKGVYMRGFKAFTLSELIIALAVLGILCAIVVPTLMSNNPNKNKMMIKKAYNVFTDVINELINDNNNYPFLYGLCPDTGDGGYLGFDCTETDSKLPYLFATQLTLPGEKISSEETLNKASGLDKCNGAASSCYYFQTDDKIIWAFEEDSIAKGSYTDTIQVGIDVNGDKGPNCYQGSTTENCKNRDSDFDQFRIQLYADGKVKINEDDEWAMEAIRPSSSLTK